MIELLQTVDSIFPNSENTVNIRIDAITANIGSYNLTIDADVSTFAKNYGKKSIPVKVNVLAVPPKWEAPTGLPMSTVVICNFEMDSVKSTDTMDKVAITIRNEVRGVANLFQSRANAKLYYAVVNVQGSASDIGEEFEYIISISGITNMTELGYIEDVLDPNLKYLGSNFSTSPSVLGPYTFLCPTQLGSLTAPALLTTGTLRFNFPTQSSCAGTTWGTMSFKIKVSNGQCFFRRFSISFNQ